MERIPAGDNPFRHDHYHQGTVLGEKVTIMHDHSYEYLIVVNHATGERARIELTEEVGKPSLCEQLMNQGTSNPTDK